METTSTLSVTYRDIAKMFCSHMPEQGAKWGALVQEYTEAIQGMPTGAKIALRAAYIFSRKAPREEREDLMQELTLKVLEDGTKDEKLAYSIARCDWKNWWARYKTHCHFSLDQKQSQSEDSEGETLAETLIGECEFERKADSEMDAESIWNALPNDEAAQSAHARRSQSGAAVELDDLIGISGQRGQTILFISHHSRKLDVNVITEVNRIIWKKPTYAHQMFERDEIADFSLKAYDFFQGIKGDVARKKASLVLNFDNFTFSQCNNGLPSYWSDELSCLFRDITRGRD